MTSQFGGAHRRCSCARTHLRGPSAVCACTHLTVFSALLSALVKELMCSNLDLLESVEQWKFGSSEPGRLLEAGGRDISTGRWSEVLRGGQRRLQDDCAPDTFGDIRAKILSLSLSATAPCVPEDDRKPVVYKFTVTPARCAFPGFVLGYSILVAFTGIVKSRIAEMRHDFWFKAAKPPEPPKPAQQKAIERLAVLKVLCFAAFLSGILGRFAFRDPHCGLAEIKGGACSESVCPQAPGQDPLLLLSKKDSALGGMIT